MTTTPGPAEASSASRALGQQVGTLLPDLLEVVGDDADLEIDDAREETCLRPENDDPQTNTRWIGALSGTASNAESGNAALDRVERNLVSQGFEKNNEVNESDTGRRALYFSRGDLGVTAKLKEQSSKYWVKIFVSLPCTDQPVEHRMQRLEIDPDYGKYSKYHDDWK